MQRGIIYVTFKIFLDRVDEFCEKKYFADVNDVHAPIFESISTQNDFTEHIKKVQKISLDSKSFPLTANSKIVLMSILSHKIAISNFSE